MSRSLPATTVAGEAWRMGLVTVLGFFTYGIVLVAAADELSAPSWWIWGDPLLGVIAIVALLWRRRFPVLIAMLTAGCTIYSLAAAPAAGLALASLATRRRWRELVLLLPLWLAAALTAGWLVPNDTEASLATALITQAAAYAAFTGIGAAIGARRDTLTALRERAETAEREQGERVARAQADERARIAREMHDVLAHRISLIAMHSGALAYRTDLPRDQVQQTAELLRDNADRAVTELREVLGVLRGEGEPEQPVGPQPDLRSLTDLVEETRAGGTEVALGVDLDGGALGTVPRTVSRHAYRVVQEALTNARKHAPGMPVEVELTGGPSRGLNFLVRNPPAPYGAAAPTSESSGMGLVGLRERVTLGGGRLAYGPDRAGRFVLHGRLPWDE
ncbi:MAG: hypothetical protein H0U62_08020 [Actinobacteria bacterium]|nr:hypothetical protein [Actinomycetota bacterium]